MRTWRGVGALWLYACAAWAQQDDAPATIAVPGAESAEPVAPRVHDTQTLDDVVVTARRKKERALDVPISLSVLDGESLGEAGLTLPTDIQERVPGLLVSVPNARLTSYTIRGLGSSSANDGIESSVGLFLDGVYLGRQGLSIFDLIDLDRVEILRGPQGTLFGKNTTAGAISIVTKSPTPEYETNLEGTLGDIGARQLRASVNGPLVDTLAGRVSGYVSQRDGTVHNVYNGGTLNNRHKHGLRGQLLWTPFEALSARFIAELAEQHEACCAFPLTAPVRVPVQARDDYMEYTRVGTNPYDHLADSDAPTRSDQRQKALSAEVNWDLGEHQRLTSISAWRDWFFVPLNDDATSLRLASTSTMNRHRQFSEELRLASNFDSFDLVSGLYYLHQHLDGLERVILGHDTVGWVFGGLIREKVLPFATESNTGPLLYALIPPESLDGLTVDTRYFQSSDSLAGFGSANWHLTQRLDLTTGLRYTYEWKSAHVKRTHYGGDPNSSVLAAGDPFLDVLDAALGTNLEQYGFNGIIDDVAGGEYERATTMSEGNWSGQLALSYKLAPDALAYASITRGYKGGGINLGFVRDTLKPTFAPEQATSYETGVKARLFDRRLSLAFDIYQTDIKNYQALTFDAEKTLLSNPRQINLLNVGKVRLRGAELEGYGYAAPGLMIRAGLAYSDAVTTEFPNAPNENTTANDNNLSGQKLYNAPRWSGNAGAEYGHVSDSALEPYGAIDYSRRTGYYGTVEHGKASYINGYGLMNLRLGMRARDRQWDVNLWTRNVLDQKYVATVYPLYGVGDYGAVPGDPRTFGITLRANLK